MPQGHFGDDPLAASAGRSPEKLAVVELATGTRLSYAALDELVSRATGWLVQTLGEPLGQRIAFLGRNGVPLLVLALAAERCGAVFVPLNWRLAPPEIAALSADCAPALRIADTEFAEALAGARDSTMVMAAIAGYDPVRPRPLDPARPIVLLYTSGTTGRPKGAIVTAINAGANATNFAAVGQVDEASVFFSDLPMFHTIGLFAVARTALMRGGTLVIADRFVPGRTLAALADGDLGITHYFAVPAMVEALERDPSFRPEALARLKAIFVGGAPLVPALIERFHARGVSLVNGYGMSEAGTVIHMPIDVEAIRASGGAVGLPAPHLELRLVDNGTDVADGQVGEVWLRGAPVTPGYWNLPAETAAAFSDGWYHTGDLARRGADGFYRIVDRLKDMYVSGGENVYPAEVETVLAAHPDVADVAVLARPDPRWGETGLALIVPRPGTAFDPGAFSAYCAARLAKYKCPARIVAIDAIPRSAAGKILKPLLRARLNAGEFS